jgi:hypothetical protein
MLGVVLVAVSAADAQAQVSGANPKVITWNPATSEAFVGILGEVQTPGVYKLEPNSLLLQSVIRRSGGLTDGASGTIRVVRQDRIVESVFFSPQSNSPILPGDLLVVESRRTQAAISRTYDSDPALRQVAARSIEPDARIPATRGIQLAFVNVLNRPVVVKIRHENAKLTHIVQMLDQPLDLAQSIRVIGPERLLSQSAAPLPVDAPLADGSVLIFPRNMINISRLPALPSAYESEIAVGAVPSLIGGPSGQSAELRNVGQLPPLVARNAEPHQHTTTSTSAQPLAIPQTPDFKPIPPPAEKLELPPAESTPSLTSRPRIATIPFTGERKITSSSTTESTEPATTKPSDKPSQQSAKLNEPSLAKDETPDLTEDIDDIEEDHPKVASGKSSSLPVGLMLGILAAVGTVIGGALATRRMLERNRTAGHSIDAEITDALRHHTTTEQLPHPNIGIAGELLTAPVLEPNPQIASPQALPEPAAATQWFSQLLGNNLPINEEAADFAQTILLQGRIAPRPVYRLDQAARDILPAPHFAGKTEIEQQAAAADLDPQQIIDEFDTAHGSRPAKPHFMRRRPGENTIAAKMAAASAKPISIPNPEIRSSETPVSDALRQLRGDQQ